METKTKKLLGAIVASVFIGSFLLVMIGMISFFQFTEEVIAPWGWYIFLMCLFGIPLLCIIINLVNRIREILGGEEDEASKY